MFPLLVQTVVVLVLMLRLQEFLVMPLTVLLVVSDRAVRTSLNCSAVIGSSGGREVVGGTFTLVEVSDGTGRLVEGSGGLVLVVVAGTGWVV